MQNKLVNLLGLSFLIGLTTLIGNGVVLSHASAATSNLDAERSPTTALESDASPDADDDSEALADRLEISLSRREVAVYRDNTVIKRYPVAVGRAGWETPTGSFKVQQMRQNPAWIHPFTNERVPGGTAENPLGTRWIGFWTDGRNWIGFHGTPNPESVGTAASHGCIRMHNADVEELFTKVELGTPVMVVQ